MADQVQQAAIVSAAEGTLTQLILKHFGDAQDVETVFLVNRCNHLYIRVITNHEMYSRDAMDALFDREDKVRDALDGILLDFDYIPRLGSPLEPLAPNRAVVVFQKEP